MDTWTDYQTRMVTIDIIEGLSLVEGLRDSLPLITQFPLTNLVTPTNNSILSPTNF